MLDKLLVFSLSLIWGSFLNFIAYRLVNGFSIFDKRSICTKCFNIILPKDLIPIISWLFLKGRCRFCNSNISILYPLIELLSSFSFLIIYNYIPSFAYISMFLYFSALLITIRTDFEHLIILDYATIYLYPAIFILNYLEMNIVDIQESILASISGYLFLFIIKYLYKKYKYVDCIGEGDLYLLALIGLSGGFYNLFISLIIGSFFSNLFGIYYFVLHKFIYKESDFCINDLKIPFGAFLALGSILGLFIKYYLLGNYFNSIFDYLY
jgi:leader peptidase (prepilin peptidase)/N-methyltransferase